MRSFFADLRRNWCAAPKGFRRDLSLQIGLSLLGILILVCVGHAFPLATGTHILIRMLAGVLYMLAFYFGIPKLIFGTSLYFFSEEKARQARMNKYGSFNKDS